jgi:hypothetical protein
MGYYMKRGNKGVPFKELGSSPNLSTDLPDLSGTTDKLGEKVDLTKKTGFGPKANVKEIEKVEVEPGSGVTLDPGYEDPIKVQEDQVKGIVPGSQTFIKKR